MAVRSMVGRIPKENRRNEKGGVFRILISSHYGQGPKSCTCEQCQIDPSNHKYHPPFNEEEGADPDYCNNIIISPKADLVARFGAEKFQRLHQSEIEHFKQIFANNNLELEVPAEKIETPSRPPSREPAKVK